MMRTIVSIAILAFSAGAVRAGPAPATQPAQASAVDPLADQILHESCDFLAKTPAFSVHAEIWKDMLLPSGHKIQVTRSEDLDVRRPNCLHVELRAHHKGRSIWDDGKQLTVLDRGQNLYGMTDAPATVDEALDMLAESYGITVPLEDIAVADPYANLTKNVTAGGYFGDEMVLGVPCRHIGFSTARIDWQMWVADGLQPLPQKLVITYKTEEQSPQYIAIFSKWKLTGRASDLPFQFVAPHGSAQIPLIDERKSNTTHGSEKTQAKP